MSPRTRSCLAAAAALVPLVLMPAPLLPPLGLVHGVQSLLGAGSPTAYLVAVIALHLVVYGALGAVAAFAVGPGQTPRQRWLRLLLVPLVVVGIAVAIRIARLGHVPLLVNAIVPIAACALGALVAFLSRQHGWRVALSGMLVLALCLGLAYWPGVSAATRAATEVQLHGLVSAEKGAATGDDRFGVLMRAGFAAPQAATTSSAVEHNRAAILALGIALGHAKLARRAGLDTRGELVRSAAALLPGTTLRGRPDWVQHFWVSAALAILTDPFVGDASGMFKEELDALTHGTGFSFADLAADRAGIRFAQAATASEAAAAALQERLRGGFAADDYFPPAADLPENLTVEQFRRDFGGVGSPRFRARVAEIEARLDRCAALAAR